jgi:hypothetical protein
MATIPTRTLTTAKYRYSCKRNRIEYSVQSPSVTKRMINTARATIPNTALPEFPAGLDLMRDPEVPSIFITKVAHLSNP